MTSAERERLGLLSTMCAKARVALEPTASHGDPPEAHMRAIITLGTEMRAKIDKLEKDYRTANENLTSVHERCSQLLNEARAQRSSMDVSVGTLRLTLKRILLDIAEERGRQDQKWGAINDKMLAIPDGTGDQFKDGADHAKSMCKDAQNNGRLTWLHVLREEAYESFAESDPEKLRAELVQVAAVAAKWIEIIDRRSSRA